MKWFDRARSLMTEAGMTQAAMADHLGISSGALSHYLMGRRDPPVELISRMAYVLGCTTDALLVGLDEPTPPASQPGRLDAAMLAEAAAALDTIFKRRGLSFDPVANADVLAAAYELRLGLGDAPKMADVIVLSERLVSLVEQVGEEKNGRVKGKPTGGIHRSAS